MPQQLMGVQSQQAEGFELCLRPLLPGLRSAALRFMRNTSDADDLVQETVLRAWRFWDHYAPGSNLRAWLHRILRNTFVNRYRSNRREAELMTQVRLISAMEAPRDPDPVPAVLSEQLQTGLSGLSPRLSAVLCAVAVDELSYREAAETLGCPIGTVMSRLHRARGALRQHLEPSPTQKCA